MVSHDLETIRKDLFKTFPTLHAYYNSKALVEIAGSFPVKGESGAVLERFNIKIVLGKSFPKTLPKVWEVSGRIPREIDRHMYSDGKACIIHPDDRWRCFPEGSSLLDYIKGPIYNFFLSQLYWEEYGEWPFGEWKHGRVGNYEFYRDMFGVNSNLAVHRILKELSKAESTIGGRCPCYSGKKVEDCCLDKINDLRNKMSPEVAKKRYESFSFEKKTTTVRSKKIKRFKKR
tara:strand:- start:12336 stop:13028 length:693 start_codon:yes stop_codon:yes gene_type:complete